MALFVDLDEDPEPPQTHQYPLKPEWNGERARHQLSHGTDGSSAPAKGEGEQSQSQQASSRELENANEHNGMAKALGCYPIVMAVASSIDLNTLDSLSKTCRQVRQGLLPYRSTVLAAALRCVNEDVPVNPADTFRYRARAGNWYYMEDGRTGYYNGKSGSCARDLVAECRRCATVVCRNCAIKPPAPAVLRDRHRRLCAACARAPLGTLARPPLRPHTPADADEMRRAVCCCETDGVWLCQPCGRSIRGADHDYKAIWKWRNQYGEVLGGLGTGIGEGDRGVVCGREEACCGAKEREQETDCDGADAREQQQKQQQQNDENGGFVAFPSPSTDGGAGATTPRPGYARHEMEGFGGIVATKLVRIVRVGACVPEWEDEKKRGQILGREVARQARSWCGWCSRVIPGEKDHGGAGVAL
ncbi:hypothetical protein GGR52DRAFT_126780 [Hypoxylon sp. FL1284]|nr:hypothetical protein GGR52DRAFT_126780 [Hypoxylon sp. FL1284]